MQLTRWNIMALIACLTALALIVLPSPSLGYDPSFDTLLNILEVIFWALPFVIIGFFLLKWATRGLRAMLVRFFLLMVPVYVVGIFVLLATPLSSYVPYLTFSLHPIILYFDPPLLWDAHFQMSLDQGNVFGAFFSVLMIVFITIWFAWMIWASKFTKTSLFERKGDQDATKKRTKIRRKFDSTRFFIVSLGFSVLIVFVLGLGLAHFLIALGSVLVTPIGVIIIVIISVIVLAIVIVKIIHKKRETIITCEWIDGVEICTERRRGDG